MDYAATLDLHARTLIRRLPLPFVLGMVPKGLDPKTRYFSWPDDELSWVNHLIHQRALEAVSHEEGFVRKIIAASYHLDAFEPDGLMFDSSEQMLRFVALYAYKVDLAHALSRITMAEAIDLATNHPLEF